MVAFLFLITGLVFQIMARPPKKDEKKKEGEEKMAPALREMITERLTRTRPG